jgi:hypothetical protein
MVIFLDLMRLPYRDGPRFFVVLDLTCRESFPDADFYRRKPGTIKRQAMILPYF